MALCDLFPDWKQQLEACAYQTADSPEASRPRLVPVFRHFGLTLP